MPATSPDSIYFSDTTTTLDLNAISGAEATSVQAALALRQRYEFVWASAAARTAQTGMLTGSTGYQVDTKTEYIYESGAWRLKTPHAVFTATTAMTTTFGGVGVFTLNSAMSTSSVFVTAGGNSGQIIITDPGIYSFTATTGYSPTVATNVTSDFGISASPTAYIVRWRQSTNVEVNTAIMPNYRTTTANFSIYVNGNASAATTATTTLYVTRIG